MAETLLGLIQPNSRIQFSETMPGGEANAIFYLVDQAGLEGATATSGVLACDVFCGWLPRCKR
ncbi:hypothetical protein [Mesorhizobium sp. M0244]|uniref:hypothetical protein n=1 Tax=Mesorhizobium sp. M0244 TaxID=2956926 RepID=UPI00333829C1